jgi:hypothetical protein
MKNDIGGVSKNKKWLIIGSLGLLLTIIIISLYLIFSIGGTFDNIKGTEYNSEEGYEGKELPDDAR